ncbi:hypothetical protein EVAR_70265_1 [Eumeta japonica]|uniref:Uncharacterized protein n=1 Tax=Eumeta variegata TaxID=151549 RepID=A0A4C2AEZ9_EUMVA|nr:hypothetical protein EVAR_70265_1 [Eumeta japonica]
MEFEAYYACPASPERPAPVPNCEIYVELIPAKSPLNDPRPLACQRISLQIQAFGACAFHACARQSNHIAFSGFDKLRKVFRSFLVGNRKEIYGSLKEERELQNVFRGVLNNFSVDEIKEHKICQPKPFAGFKTVTACP